MGPVRNNVRAGFEIECYCVNGGNVDYADKSKGRRLILETVVTVRSAGCSVSWGSSKTQSCPTLYAAEAEDAALGEGMKEVCSRAGCHHLYAEI